MLSLAKDVHLVKNTGDNWSTYKYHVETYACGINAYDILIGAETRPEPLAQGEGIHAEQIAARAAEIKNYNERDRALTYYLRASQTETGIVLITAIQEPNSRKIWTTLLNQFESKANVKASTYLVELQNLTQGGSNVIQHIWQCASIVHVATWPRAPT